jgi:hypothetical protein
VIEFIGFNFSGRQADALSQPGWTNLWRFWLVIRGEYAMTMKKLHEKHGPVVRLGPNLLDLDFPELSKIIYGTDGKWRKVSTTTISHA